MADAARADEVAPVGDRPDVVARLAPLVPRLAAEWPPGDDGPSWRSFDGSLVFADISGFTALSERLAALGPVGAEELTGILGQAFADLLALAYDRGGSLVKFGGDALLLLFDGPGHGPRAVDAAVAMRTAMRRGGRLTTSVGPVRLRMSVGVHAGELVAVRAGASHRELLLVGPGTSAVVAAESAAAAGEVVVTPGAAAQLDPGLLAAPKGPGFLLRNVTRLAGAEPVTGYAARAAMDAVAEAVPVAIREHLLAGGGESEHRPAVIAFVHFDGTDGLLEREGPERLARALDHLVRDTQEAAESHGVTFLASDLDHDGGKLILAGGVPRALGDDEGRMLRALHQIAGADRELPVRIGVNRGRIFAGEVGPPYRRTFTVMGDAVNLAARLMAKAAPGQVLASVPVLERSRTTFETTALEPFLVKGKRDPVAAVAVGAPQGTQETIGRSRSTELIGRDDELAVLREVVADAGAGRGRVVVIEGAVGAGKTRLVDELRRQAATAGVVEQRLVQCEQYEAATPYFAIRHLLRAVLGDVVDVVPRLRALAPDLEPWAPLLGDVLGQPIPDTARTRSLEARFRPERTNAVVAQLLAAAVPGPAVLAFEDTHWMDAASAAALDALRATTPGRPWVVVLTRRLDDGDGGGTEPAGGPAVTTLRLAPLDDAAAGRLVAAAAGAPVRPDRRQAIVRLAGGNPLFLEELAVQAATSTGELPDSVEAVLGLQIDRLPVTAGRVLRTAAVLGSSFEPRLLAQLAQVDLADVLPDLVDHLVAEPDGRLRFRHRLLRDVAYGLLPYERRRQLHGWAADAMEAEGEGKTHPARLSLHCFHAQRYERSRSYAVRAGDRARRQFALPEARELYERAVTAAQREARPLPAPRQAGLWRRLGTTLQLLGEYDAATAAFERVRVLSRGEPLELARASFRLSELAERRGDARAAGRWLARGLREIEGLETPSAQAERAYFLVRRAWLRLQQGRGVDARRESRRAVRVAESSGDRGAMAAAYTMVDTVQVALGRPDLAVHAGKALAIYRSLRRRDSLAALLNNLGAFAYYQGRWSEALRLYDESRRNFEKTGNVVDAALGTSNIAEIFADQGRLDEAERLLSEVIETWRSLSFPLGLARATRFLARVHLRRGDPVTALDRFDEARAVFEEYGLVGNVHEVDVWRAECLLRLGRRPEAEAALEEALAFEVSSGGTDLQPMVHRLRAAAAAARGDLDTAWAEADESLHQARTRGAAFDVALALEAESLLAQLGGRPLAEDARRERDALLRSLGVVAPPAPLVPSAAGR